MIRLRVVGGILIAAACAVPAAAQEESEFQPLRAWMPVGTVLAAPPADAAFTLTSGVVQTPANYGDFVLRFDFASCRQAPAAPCRCERSSKTSGCGIPPTRTPSR